MNLNKTPQGYSLQTDLATAEVASLDELAALMDKLGVSEDEIDLGIEALLSNGSAHYGVFKRFCF